MAQSLQELAAPPEDPRLIPSTHATCNISPRDPKLPLGICGCCMHMVHSNTRTQNFHTHKTF